MINAAVSSTAQTVQAEESSEAARSPAVRRFMKGDYAPA